MRFRSAMKGGENGRKRKRSRRRRWRKWLQSQQWTRSKRSDCGNLKCKGRPKDLIQIGTLHLGGDVSRVETRLRDAAKPHYEFNGFPTEQRPGARTTPATGGPLQGFRERHRVGPCQRTTTSGCAPIHDTNCAAKVARNGFKSGRWATQARRKDTACLVETHRAGRGHGRRREWSDTHQFEADTLGGCIHD